MADSKDPQFSNLNDVKVNTYIKGLIKDYNDSFVPEGVWTNAINAVTASHQGDMYTISNEASTLYCTQTAFEVIGVIHKNATQWFIFSTNDLIGEIGTFDESNCSYTRHTLSACLNFKRSNLISGATQKNYDCTYSVFFADGLNPDRAFNPDNIPYIIASYDTSDANCPVPIYDDPPRLDCSKLRLQYLVKVPCYTLERSNSAGTLFNGSYQVTVAYTLGNLRVTDYFNLSNVASIWTHENNGSSLDLVFTELDTTFEEYEVVLISTVNERTIARRVGFYSTRQTTVHIDDNTDALVPIPLEDVPVKQIIYTTSDKIFSLNGYLLRSGTYSKPEFNYQPLANQIVAKWIQVEYPSDYYVKGNNETGYMRDEVYSYFIRWVYNTGDRSASYHIPGRPARQGGADTINVGGKDVMPYDNPGSNPLVAPTWKVYNTAITTGGFSATLPNGGTVTGSGYMSYWQSTEKYPVKPLVWNSSSYPWSTITSAPYPNTIPGDYDLCGDFIRHHKFPDDGISPLFNNANGNINLLGVRFENIKIPVDQDGNEIKDIVGYEILRGSREGNRSIIAKGLIYNMFEYTDEALPGSKILYQNYPFNCLKPDYFLRKGAWYTPPTSTDYDATSNPISLYRKDYFSFHSPDFTFRGAYLNPNEIKVYREYQGIATGSFVQPLGHPKQKIPSYAAFIGSMLLGLGLTIQQFTGKKTTIAGNIADPATLTAANTTGTAGTAGGIAASSAASVAGATGFIGGTWYPPTPGSISGLNLPTIQSEDSGLSNLNFTAKKGNTIAQLLSYLQQINLIASVGAFYLAQNFGNIYKSFKELIPWVQYALQYNGVGSYNFGVNVSRGNTRRLVNKARYVGDSIQQFDPTYVINNINRPRSVVVNLADTLNDPAKKDNSRQTVGEQKIWTNPTKTTRNTISAYYAGLKIDNPSQYNQLSSIAQIPIGTCVQNKPPGKGVKAISQIYFGGDVYINRYTELNKFTYFSNWAYDLPDGTDFNYKLYANIPYPRYWANFADFDLNDVKLLPGFPSFPQRIGLVSLIQFVSNLVRRFAGFVTNPISFITSLIGGPSFFYHLDRDPVTYRTSLRNLLKANFYVKNAFFYLFNNGVKDFYCESEINLACRDYGDLPAEQFYNPYGFTNLNQIFKTDLITVPEFFKYDFSLSASKLASSYVSWGSILPNTYDPNNQDCFEYFPKRLIYSLLQQYEQSRENWRIYLANNYRDFESRITNVKTINRTGAVILFEDAIPTTINGVDELRTSAGNRITVGDAGLFNQSFQNLVNAELELEYGSCQSERAVINTPYGVYWMSQRNGKIMHLFNNQITDISMNGMRYWFAENLYYKLLKEFPDFPHTDNPVFGVGCQAVYDNQYELLYFTKKDYKKKASNLKIAYDSEEDIFKIEGYSYSFGLTYGVSLTDDIREGYTIQGTINNQPLTVCAPYATGQIQSFVSCLVEQITACPNIKLVIPNITAYGFTLSIFLLDDTIPANFDLVIQVRPTVETPIVVEETTNKAVSLNDPKYFENCSWTISYDPKIKAWISFHDWHPDFVFPTNDHFFSIYNNSFWKHNDRCDSYGNFYNINHGWEVEFPVNTQTSVTTIKSIEYYLEVFKYNISCYDRYHVLDGNFDQAILYNTEQVSGILNLNIMPKNNPVAMLTFPKLNVNLQSYDILVAKEENKYRFNQFWDIARDRGEFSGKQITNFITECNGYRINVNPGAVDYDKPLLQRKKFRHYGNRVILRRTSSGPEKMNLKVVTTKETLSPR